jgi:hypothetical protein
MPTFQLALAHDVSVYGTVEVEADDYAAAVEKVRADLDDASYRAPIWSNINDVEWDTSFGFRVVGVYLLDDNGMGDSPLVEGIQISVPDDSIPLSAEEVLAAITAKRISK